MKAFMLVTLLVGLLVAMWLVVRGTQEQTAALPGGAAVVKPIERSAQMRRTVEAADQAKERKLDAAARD